MASDADASEDMVEQLVHQFSDPFAFYRELIQNGIDAGSSRIEVTLRFAPGREQGVATASVQDWGEGMNREIIESFLLTKFRSSKENDLTKIGKFGIGFMSVFSPGPELVVVETGRDAEFWRLLFHADRRYELLRCPEPVEGTRVTLHKPMKAGEYRQFSAKSRAAIERWCRHSEADVTFAAGEEDGGPPGPPQAVKQPLAVDAPFQVEYREEGTLIVAGPSRQEPAPCGMYNRGLTLLESTEPFFPGVAFKIVSRYLEHTLTRDNVRRDRHFERAMGLVKKLIDGPMRQRLPEALQRAAHSADDGRDYEVLLAFAKGRLGKDELWFRRSGGKAVQGAELRRSISKAGVLMLGPPGEADNLVAGLSQAGLVVLAAEPGDPAEQVARQLFNPPRVQLASEAFLIARPEPAVESGRLLCAGLAALLEASGARPQEVALASIQGESQRRLAVCVEALGRPVSLADASSSPFAKKALPLLCLNRADPRILSALELAAQSPRLAALFLFRLLATAHGALDERTDWKITELSLSR